MNKIELSKRIDVSLKTLYNWEETKPELINLIKLGLEKEKELENGSNQNNEKLISEITNKVSLSLDEQLNEFFERRRNRNLTNELKEIQDFIYEKRLELNKFVIERKYELNNLANERQNELNKILEKIENDKK